MGYPVEVLTPPDLYERAFTFAHTHGLVSSYDCLYVVFAQLVGVELWSADERLLNAVAGIAPWVHAIRAYPL